MVHYVAYTVGITSTLIKIKCYIFIIRQLCTECRMTLYLVATS